MIIQTDEELFDSDRGRSSVKSRLQSSSPLRLNNKSTSRSPVLNKNHKERSSLSLQEMKQ